ncbi:MAG TPA: hypothetical protein EYP36_01905 [Calditrichaeota bacterium]|nr:hypothetical protein [Calditrichota bacterium]
MSRGLSINTVVRLSLVMSFLIFGKICAQEAHQLNLSVTLSGHIFIGVGYTYSFDQNWQAGATVLLAPETGLPFAFNIGGGYLSNGQNWRARLWGEYMIIASPPDPDKRKILPMINFVPGVVYYDGKHNEYSAEVWLSYLPVQKKFAPTGLEFQYGRHF